MSDNPVDNNPVSGNPDDSDVSFNNNEIAVHPEPEPLSTVEEKKQDENINNESSNKDEQPKVEEPAKVEEPIKVEEPAKVEELEQKNNEANNNDQSSIVVIEKSNNDNVELANIKSNNVPNDDINGPLSKADLPSITIAYQDLSCKLQVPVKKEGYATIISPIVNLVKTIGTCGKSNETKDFYRINNATGIIKPGTMTLIIAPPGHGKSSLLRALAGRMKTTSGTLLFNGHTIEEAHTLHNANIYKMTQYVEQVDVHLPLLTVRETLDFAHKVSSSTYDATRVTKAIELLGLEECQNTILGNEFIRGVSGGQKRRVTIGEMIVGDSRCLFLDEYTNGLDTATSEDITRGLRQWVKDTNGIMVCTLQQPTPGLYSQFDQIICLRDSSVIYHGPREDVLHYFQSMGYNCPHDVDVCDFLIDCLSQPRLAIQRQQIEERKYMRAKLRKLKKSNSNVEAVVDDMQIQQKDILYASSGEVIEYSSTPCVTQEEILNHYHNSIFYKNILKDIELYIPNKETGLKSHPDGSSNIILDPLLPTEKAKKAYGHDFSLPLFTLLGLIVSREGKSFFRNKGLLMPRIIQAIIMGLMFGSLYYQVGTDMFFLRTATLLIALTQVAFGNMVELPIAVANTRIVYKHTTARFYPAWNWIVAATLCSIPLFFIETVSLGSLIYWMSGCSSEAIRYIIFVIVALSQSFNMSVWFRLLSAVGKDEASAQAIAGPSTGVFMLFGGFFVTANNMPDFMLFLFWISPFSWSTRALANNEFSSSKYDTRLPVNNYRRTGDVYLEQLDMKIGEIWILWAIIYLYCLSALIIAVHALLLRNNFRELSRGTIRFDDDDQDLLDNEDELLEVDVDNIGQTVAPNIIVANKPIKDNISNDPNTPGSQISRSSFTSNSLNLSGNGPNTLRTLREALPHVPTWLSFSNIKYSVPVIDENNNTIQKPLLQGVSGYAEPGKLTALMGASGAGKTTLLDVLAGRKSAGSIEGNIMLNGRIATPLEFSSVTGYVEQFDNILPYDTVLETLRFAAYLRLPSDVSKEIKNKIVDEIIDILDLTSIRNQIIGNHLLPGLSPSQLKRVNIGIELVANPAVLFLDEPTTGLDSKSAQTVMRVVRRIARSGRSVICTIHQPSAELFYLFDRLVLLASGGFQIYFGDLGKRSTKFINYLSAIDGVKPIPPRYNPASWMLEELGVGVASLKQDNMENGEEQLTGLEYQQKLITKFCKYFVNSKEYNKLSERLNILESLVNNPEQLQIVVQNDIENAAIEQIEEEEKIIKERESKNNINVNANDLVLSTESKDNVDNEEVHQLTRSISYSMTSSRIDTAQIVNGKISLAKRAGYGTQFAYLVVRSIRSYWRNPPFLFSRLTVQLILSILFGLIYLDVKVTSQSSVLSKIAAISVSATFGCLIAGATATPNMIAARAVFYRERSSGMYAPGFWSTVTFITELLFLIPSVALIQIPAYFLIGLRLDVGAFFQYSLAIYTLLLIFVSMSQFVTALAPNAPAAGVMQGAYFGLFFTFSGIAITANNIPIGWKWFFHMLPVAHINEALVMPQFKTCSNIPFCGNLIPVVEGNQNVLKHVSQAVSDYLGFTYDYYWQSIGWAALFLFSAQILAFITSTFLVHNKR